MDTNGSSNATPSPRISIRRRVADAGDSYDDAHTDAAGLPTYQFIAVGALTLGLYIGLVFSSMQLPFIGKPHTSKQPQLIQSPPLSSLHQIYQEQAAAQINALNEVIQTQKEAMSKQAKELAALHAAVRVPYKVATPKSGTDVHRKNVKHKYTPQINNPDQEVDSPNEKGTTGKAALNTKHDAHDTQLRQHQQMVDLTLSSNKKDASDIKLQPSTSDITEVTDWKTLPSSSVWCYGSKRADRVCRFRNLCYHPKHDDWFILKTNSSVLHNVPDQVKSETLLETGTVENHPYFFWNYVEASPFHPSLQNIKVRFEDLPHFIFKRLHPKNIMHNLHDDLLGMYYMLKEFVGRGTSSRYMPFSLDGHRVLIIDPYDATDSTRIFQYLTNFPLRFSSYLKQKNEEHIVTCFRDAYVGNTKLTTWYQYGFNEPQGPIAGKSVNGMYLREVGEWFMRRLVLPLGHDEDPTIKDLHPLPSLPSNGTYGKEVDFQDTDTIVVLSRKGNRLILNEEQMAKDLEKAFGYKVIFVSNEQHTFEEQIVFLRKARIVIGMHGSILVMVMFCRRGTVVIEMYPFAVPGDHYTPYKTLASLNGMDLVYRKWENKHSSKSVAHPHNHPLHGGIDTLPLSEQTLIINTLTVPQHKCCASPYWLYRIYQDTEVTTSEVIEIINDALVESRKTLVRVRETNFHKVDVLPALVKNIRCLEHANRPPNTLWMAWDPPWNGVKIEKWNVHTMNDGSNYITMGSEPTISIPNLKTNTTIRVFIRPVIGTWKGDWSSRGECVV
ncbi:hypothetical protein BATDEDRAFT_92595 [Batrachochytrium dendrobatidis JAM81]|uniref:Glycosyltransferase 61 catalytic domain-containing protein n=1 Tax=Batrachochytrium dendrobatidis (strain JAM81 / FGSC 10211) TaxID=684364 RepID=F4PE93_BATDJ|nr:uncharacterized protein BATDEDRAFT_92595 [Batrachochytrium dendrobatidis JAM81]EGF76611.1 hypothetical protein BATDEDRAFT_92595 [Batrachochytrium dendrobatidis JAM81]|eukprot:XP_006682930.1 hypothetical protein BATDEDRAFT_92595 [Batrachochytrium dendrobatidis JAM81]